MNGHQVIQIIQDLQNRVTKLEQQIISIREGMQPDKVQTDGKEKRQRNPRSNRGES